tara:strand:+ start:978 stop:2996 length:2019 start_codon:yes stop_codon:yes gene_type:complete
MKKYLLFLQSILFLSNVLFSQTKIDSALNLMNVDSIHDTTKLWNLYEVSTTFVYENPDSTNKLLDIGLNYLKSSNQLFQLDSNQRMVKDLFRKFYFNAKGICFYVLDRQSECLDMWLRTEKIVKRQKDSNFLLRITNNLAIVYSLTDREEEALQIFKNQKKIYESKKDTGQIISVTRNMASMMSEMRVNKDSTILLLNYVLELAKKINRNKSLSGIYASLAVSYLDPSSKNTFNLSKSKKCLDSLLVYANRYNDNRNKVSYYEGMTQYYYYKNQYRPALKNANKAAKLSKKISGITSIQTLDLLYELHKKLKNYKKANSYLEQRIENKDSLDQLSAKEDVARYESEKEFAIKQQLDSLKYLDEIKLQQAETRAKEEEIRTQKIIEGVLFVGILLVIGFLGFVYKQLNTTKKQKLVIEQKQEEISDSINYAKRIQDAMMTSSVYLKDTLPKSFIFFKPKDVVSGDFYWIHKDQEENIFFTVADCTGHGVPGAFMSMIGTSLLNEIIIEKGIKETDKILVEMRAQIIKSLHQEEDGAQKDGMDISLCKLNMKKKTVEFSGAHNSLVHISGDELSTYRGDHQPVGLLLGDKKPFTKHKVKLNKDDMLYIYTDGYQDQFGGEKGKKYKGANFKKMLLKISRETEPKQLSLLEKDFVSWINNYEQIDDVCVMGVRII